MVEVTAGVQFRPLSGLRGPTLGPLWEKWRAAFPLIEEQPALPPFLEAEPNQGLAMQLNFSPVRPTRFWFRSPAGPDLIQVQNDRLIVNWRRTTPDAVYPRYGHVRGLFVDRYRDLASFVTERELGSLTPTQVELSYINQIEQDQHRVADPLAGWDWTRSHHLGLPSQSRVAATFDVGDLGIPPVRLHVSADPATALDGRAVTFFTLTLRGAPDGGDLTALLRFFDRAHEHIVESFTELTTVSMHQTWRRLS